MNMASMQRTVLVTALTTAFTSLGLLGFSTAPSRAQPKKSADAMSILKTMTDYVTSQKEIAATFNADIEVITPELQKIQFTSTGHLQMSRPDKLHATRTGGYSNVALFFDGKTMTVDDKDGNRFAQVDVPGTIDQLITKLRSELPTVSVPGADLLLSDVYKNLSAGVLDSKDVGRGVINGIECEHLAFRDLDTDWQIWIEVGSKPIPRKYVITSKTEASGPQYTLVITDWKTGENVSPVIFEFKPPAGAKKVQFKDLTDIDLVPPGVVQGGNQ